MISSFMSKVTLLRVESVEARPDSRPMAGCSGDLHECDADCDCDSLLLLIAGLGIACVTSLISCSRSSLPEGNSAVICSNPPPSTACRASPQPP